MHIYEPALTDDVIYKTDLRVAGLGIGGLVAALVPDAAGLEPGSLPRHGCFDGNITRVYARGFGRQRKPNTFDDEGNGLGSEGRGDVTDAAPSGPRSSGHALGANMSGHLTNGQYNLGVTKNWSIADPRPRGNPCIYGKISRYGEIMFQVG